MKTLLLIVDDGTSREYEGLDPETKQQFAGEVSNLLKKVANDVRCAKLNKLVQEINNENDYDNVEYELLLKLLPVD